MKKILLTLLVAITTLTMVVTEAEARRMGGGGSFGKQSQSFSRSAPRQAQQAPANAAKSAAPAGQAAPKPASPLRNILGGALLGLGLGALLSHLGLSGALASMISTLLMVALLAFAAMFIFRMLARRNGTAAQANAANARTAYAGDVDRTAYTPEIGSRLEPQPALGSGSAVDHNAQDAGNQPWGVPADFDSNAFLRSAKTYFIRLQAAWDKADINDISEFTTPEMFAELKLQIQERGATPNTTDVVAIDAERLGIETIDVEYLACVKFSGRISEDVGAPAQPFTEIWNLSKPVNGNGGWALAGIQQVP
jgi:predicted lipid-binding transport protein (Tim44 family)